MSGMRNIVRTDLVKLFKKKRRDEVRAADGVNFEIEDPINGTVMFLEVTDE